MSGFSNIKNSYISSASWNSHVTNTVRQLRVDGNEVIYDNYQLQTVHTTEQVKTLKERNHTAWRSNYPRDDVSSNSQIELRQKSREIHEALKKSRGLMSVSNSHGSSSAPHALDALANSLDERSPVTEKRGSRLKHVLLIPDRRLLTGNESSGVEMCKKLFGITIFQYSSNGKAKWNPSVKDRKLVVQDVAEGSVSHLTGRIHRGDMLVCINGDEVTWHNFARLLHSLHKREPVRLTFQSPKIVGPKPTNCILKVPDGDICFAVLGKRLSQIQSEISQCKCVAMFLTLLQSTNEKAEDSKEDIVYLFPHEEETLSALRGLFITLCSFLVDVVNQPATCSNLTFPDGNVTVAYKQCGRDVLVFAMPENRISSSALHSVLEAFFSLMVLLFQDVKSAFTECDTWWVDKILALMFHQALGLTSNTLSLTQASICDTLLWALSDYHTVRALSLSHENQLLCDEILTEMESMDFDNFLEATEVFSRRLHVIQGTSLFYKGYLLSSHLQPHQQRDVNLFMNCHGLLALSARQDVSEVVVWQEMKLYSSRDDSALPLGYRPSKTNSFLMIVGKKHYYLVAIVEGQNCSSPIQAPPSLLEKQARATLDQLETEDVHMSSCCEERLNSLVDGVLLSSAEQLCTVSSPRSRSVSRNQRLSSSSKSAADSFLFSRSKSADRTVEKDLPTLADLNGAVLMKRHGSKLSYGSNDSAGSSNSTGPPRSKGSRVSSITDLSGIARSFSSYQIETPLDIFKTSRLCRGKENTLFSYVHLDCGEGIIISPTDVELNEVYSSLQVQLMNHFSSACQKIKSLFSEQTDGIRSAVFNTDSLTESSCRESGVMFQCTYQQSERKHQLSTLSFWVVGKCMQSPTQQEIYVCFHESTKQSAVEMAFSLGFGR